MTAGAWEKDQVARLQGDRDHVNTVARENLAADSKEIAGESTIQDIELATGEKMPWYRKVTHVTSKFLRFVGPGILISVAYIDPDNFQSNVSSGAEFKFKLLFMILVGNGISAFLQSMSIKLGSVTGLDLAQMNRASCPFWLNVCLWLLAEAAIICTDVGSVIGFAIGVNLLNPAIPLPAACAISLVDTLLILFFYRPWGALRWLRAFEFFIASIVFATVICLIYLLALIDTEEAPAGQVFLGFLPSRTVFVGDGLLESCGIIGGTIMPHTIYLGSSIVQARLRDFDVKTKHYELPEDTDENEAKVIYRPSLAAIKSCMAYSIAELCSTLLIIAIFVNSAILIVAAASFDDDDAESADLFALYELFSETISPSAATLFALGLMLSSMACSVVATMAGQMILEGAMQWHISPFVRRLATRSIAIIPAIAIAASVGKAGLANALYACNIVLSVNLIFTCAPLLWYVCRDKYMTVAVNGSTTQGHPISGKQQRREDAEREKELESVSLANGWIGKFFSALIWVVIVFMNVASWVLLGLGKIDDL
ncbi:hypothetical protein H072_2527 [Dactylellina haptotyla CBS 200.50]|uniref:Manganese transporter n=1 Tax=Dactylellina haptotyla (strain CBS 200.50) TaxID=1284197 RepID=S8AKN5_DACHA|nr:hypothetical protein H072_2527 [Dactylellina haptotyla CBS 200.50]